MSSTYGYYWSLREVCYNNRLDPVTPSGSRSREFRADAAEYMGENSRYLMSALEKIEGEEKGHDFFATHPPMLKRVERLQALMA